MRIILIYAVLGGLWILFSDRLLGAAVSDPATLTMLQTIKGWAYVLATALLIYCLIRWDMEALRRSEEALQKANAELEARVTERTRELTEVNRQLQEIDRFRSELLATMSH